MGADIRRWWLRGRTCLNRPTAWCLPVNPRFVAASLLSLCDAKGTRRGGSGGQFARLGFWIWQPAAGRAWGGSCPMELDEWEACERSVEKRVDGSLDSGGQVHGAGDARRFPQLAPALLIGPCLATATPPPIFHPSISASWKDDLRHQFSCLPAQATSTPLHQGMINV